MSQPITTLIVRALDSGMTANDPSTHLATAIQGSAGAAAESGRLAIQKNGAFVAGNATSTADDFLKLSVALRAANRKIVTHSSPEFKKGDIKSSHYRRSLGIASQIMRIEYNGVTAANKLGGQLFLRIEGQGQGTGELTETYSGETQAQIVAQFNKRKAAGTTQFDFINLTVSGTAIVCQGSAMPFGTQMQISGNDGAVITDTSFGTDGVGTQQTALELERKSNIRSGVTNQIGFPIVEPATLVQPADYGIYTIEIEREAGHNNIVKEEIKVLIKDDEANASLTLTALQTVLGLSSADVVAPTLTTAVFSLTNGNTATDSDYSVNSNSAMFVKLAGAGALGDTVTVTVTSAETGDAGHNNVTTHTLASDADNIPLGVTANQFTASTVLTATTVITDAAGNVSAIKTDTVTTAS